ncbi:hypothetical protein NKI18_27685 [Mesorhizobium sp. M0800]
MATGRLDPGTKLPSRTQHCKTGNHLTLRPQSPLPVILFLNYLPVGG